MIKAALALHHRVLPPTIGVTEPNPKANFPDSPFYVNTEARPWLASPDGHPRRASVSAFGFGGTDFHIALEEYTGGYLPHAEATVERWPGELLLWRGDAGRDRRLAGLAGGPARRRRRAGAGRPGVDARPGRARADRRRGGAGAGGRVARRPARQARRRAQAAGRRAGAAARPARHPLRADPARRRRRRRLPVPRSGLPEGRHGSRAGAGVPRGARGVRARRPAARRPLRAAAQPLRVPAADVHRRGRVGAPRRADRHARRPGGARRDRARLPAGARASSASSPT